MVDEIVDSASDRVALRAELDRHKYDGDNRCICGESFGGTSDGVVWTVESNAHIADAVIAAGFGRSPLMEIEGMHGSSQ